MNPAPPLVLGEIAGLLMAEAMSGTAPDKAQDLALSAALAGMIAETFDAYVHNLVEENRAVRGLLGETGQDADLRVSALTVENHRLRARLIERHAQAELAGEAEFCDAIWRELAVSTERRRISSAPC